MEKEKPLSEKVGEDMYIGPPEDRDKTDCRIFDYKDVAEAVKKLKYMLCKDCGRIPTADIIDKVSKIFGDFNGGSDKAEDYLIPAEGSKISDTTAPLPEDNNICSCGHGKIIHSTGEGRCLCIIVDEGKEPRECSCKKFTPKKDGCGKVISPPIPIKCGDKSYKFRGLGQEYYSCPDCEVGK